MDIVTFLILALGIFLGFFVQTIAGFAAGLIALPILCIVLPLPEASAFISVFFFIFSALMIYKSWDHIDKKIIFEMLPGIILGLILGVYVLKAGDPVILKKILGIFIILYVIYTRLKKVEIRLFKKLGLLFGLMGGFASGVFSSGGQFLIVYINNKINAPRLIRATIIGSLAISNFLRVPLLAINGLLTLDIFIKTMFVMPFFIFTLYLSYRFYKKINENTLKNIIIMFLLLSGIFLTIR